MTSWTDDEVGGTVWSDDESGAADGSLTGSEVDVDADKVRVIDATDNRPKLVTVEELLMNTESFTQSGTGAISRTVHGKFRETISVLDFIPTALHDDIADGTSATDVSSYVQLALNEWVTSGFELYIPAGTYLIGSKLTKTFPTNHAAGGKIRGAGRGRSILKYTGSASIGSLLEFDSSGYCLNLDISGFKIDVTSAPAGTVGFRIWDGIWRSCFSDLFVTRDAEATRSGSGIFMGSTTALDAGSFDNKFSKIYISNFDSGFRGAGTSLSDNTVTNLSISDSYISSCDQNLLLDYASGVILNGTQLELARVDGALLNNCETVLYLGGTIESTESGATGINMDANTKNVIAICDFYNNDGGNFLSNGNIGHFYKTTNGGFVYPAGAELRIDSDGTDDAYIRFFSNGVADVRIRVADSGDAISITGSNGVEDFKISASGVFELLTAAGFIRFRDGSYMEFFQSGSGRSTIKCGTGSPEGVTTSLIGSLWLQRDAPGTLWRKESGTGNTGWRAIASCGVSADKGDAAATLTVGTDPVTNIWNTELTQDRAVTLSTTSAYNGAKFRVVRGASATGAFNLNIGTGPLKALGSASTWAEVEYNGSAWVLTAAGSL
jgi:hypothetical protein